MELNQIEKQILIDTYEFNINHKETIKRINYELVETDNHEKDQEFASYLLNLKRLKYIEFDEKATLTPLTYLGTIYIIKSNINCTLFAIFLYLTLFIFNISI